MTQGEEASEVHCYWVIVLGDMQDLVKARAGFIMETDLHIMYLVTPIREDLLASTCPRDRAKQRELLWEVYRKLTAIELKVAACLGLRDHEVHGSATSNSFLPLCHERALSCRCLRL